jgi:hypothetical protein
MILLRIVQSEILSRDIALDKICHTLTAMRTAQHWVSEFEAGPSIAELQLLRVCQQKTLMDATIDRRVRCKSKQASESGGSADGNENGPDLAKVSRENVRTGAKILKALGAVQLL